MTNRDNHGTVSKMEDREKIKSFVQNVLGCGCAEEVFKVIELKHEKKGSIGYDRVNIGNRLLIYILKTDDPKLVETALPDMVLAGKKERDDLGLNRFRMVLATDAQAAGIAAMKAYKKLAITDDRLFLHVVKPAQTDFRA